MKKFKTRRNIPEITIHCSSAEVESVSLLCPHHHLPAPGGEHVSTPAVVGVVSCLLHLLVVVVEVGEVGLSGVNSGLHTEGDPPTRHSPALGAVNTPAMRGTWRQYNQV